MFAYYTRQPPGDIFRIPPGFVFVGSLFPKLLTAVALGILVKRYATFLPISGPDGAVSSWAWAVFFFIGLVLVYATVKSTVRRRIVWARKCKRLNARMPHFLHGTVYTMGLDMIYSATKGFLSGYIADAFLGWERRADSRMFGFEIFGDYVLSTSEPDHIKAILSTDFESFEKGERFRRDYESVLGMGVFNSDGEMWKFHRNMTRPFFTRERVDDFDLFDRHASAAIYKMKERFAEGESVDFQDLMSRFTLDTAAEFLFGSRLNSLTASLPYAWNSTKKLHAVGNHDTGSDSDQRHPSDIFAQAFNDAQFICSRRSRMMNTWHLLEFFKDQTRKHMSIIYEYVDPVLKEAFARKESGVDVYGGISAPRDEPETLLDHLVQEISDITTVRDEIINIMIAGRDTTMATITFATYCLSQHPKVLDQLRKEILDVVGPSKRPTHEDVKRCQYLRAVINETLRLYPPVPFNFRRSKRHTTFPTRDGGKPYFVPANTDIIYSVWVMHRREDLWGPDASTFDPSRFLDERAQKYLIPNPFIFLPFNAGPRICLGQQFAYQEVSVMLIRLLQEFESIQLDSDAQPPNSRPPTEWKHTLGVWMKMKEAKDDSDKVAL